MRDDSAYLDYIEEATRLVERYLGEEPGIRDRFYADTLLHDAVMRRLEIIGEATNHLSAELRSRHPEIEWGQLIGFRNVLAHGYMDVELDLVWKAIAQDLPALKALVASELG